MDKNNNIEEFFGDDTIKGFVEGLWSEVFKASNKLIQDTNAFGFSDIAILPNPNIFQMINSLTLIDIMIDIVLPLEQDGKFKSSVNLLNAKQQILNMRMIATAINDNDRDAYEAAVRRLNNQALV